MPNLIDTVGEDGAGINAGSTVMIGGFVNAGQPFELIETLMDCGATDLARPWSPWRTVANNDCRGNEQIIFFTRQSLRELCKLDSHRRKLNSWDC